MFQVHLFGRKSEIIFNSSSSNNNNNAVPISNTTIPTIIFEAAVTSF
jgi:hypothetical protein